MRMGEDWAHEFTLPFDAALVRKAEIVYAQQWERVITKTEADCSLTGNTVQLTVTAEETMRLNHKKSLQVQAQFLLLGGKRVRTDIYIVNVDPVLSKVVLT